MKIGFTSLTLRNEDIESVVNHASQAGLSGIEWGVSDTHVILGDFERAKKINALTVSHGLEVFSMGSYCRMTDKEECVTTVETAVALSAPVIRVWAGYQSPQDCDESTFKTIVENTRFMADLAQKHEIIIGFEFHHSTLTETAKSAIELIKAVDRKNVGLYWQPSYHISPEENIAERNLALPYCMGNLHVQNYSPDNGYGLLCEIEDILNSYYLDIKDKPFKLMIEFVKDGLPENLIKDSACLHKILG